MTTAPKGRRQQQGAASEESGDTASDAGLHLPSLSITGFRGIDELHIPRLGRVTLIVGDNGVGKSTVLEAVRLYASRGDSLAITDILADREEFSAFYNADGDVQGDIHWPRIFHSEGRDRTNRIAISTLPQAEDGSGLVIETVDLAEDSPEVIRRKREMGVGDFRGTFFAQMVSYGDKQWRLSIPDLVPHVASWTPLEESGPENIFDVHAEVPPIKWHLIEPNLPNNEDIARDWQENRRIDPLYSSRRIVEGVIKSIAGVDLDRVGLSVYKDDSGKEKSHVVAVTKDDPLGRPLKSLGEGAYRLLVLALALNKSIDGFLLIDEAENGIHYSRHEDYWRILIEIAVEYNIQVLATTHSYDCIRGFARAISSKEDGTGMLIRLDKDENGTLTAAGYTHELLQIMDELSLEVR